MTTIILLAVAAWLMLERFGPSSSAAALMSALAILVLTALGVTDYEAKSGARGAMRRGICILVSTISGLVAFGAFALSTDLIEPYLPLDGPLDSSDGPVKYAVVAVNVVVMVLGAWLPLRAMSLWGSHRWRLGREEPPRHGQCGSCKNGCCKNLA